MRQPSAAPESSMEVVTETWRPMAFGHMGPHKIADPVCEPLWGGRRVLVDVRDGDVVIRGTDGEALEGYEDLRDRKSVVEGKRVGQGGRGMRHKEIAKG